MAYQQTPQLSHAIAACRLTTNHAANTQVTRFHTGIEHSQTANFSEAAADHVICNAHFIRHGVAASHPLIRIVEVRYSCTSRLIQLLLLVLDLDGLALYVLITGEVGCRFTSMRTLRSAENERLPATGALTLRQYPDFRLRSYVETRPHPLPPSFRTQLPRF